MSRAFHRDVAVRIRPAVKTSGHGGTKLDWVTAERTPLTGIRITPLTAEERDGRSLVTHRLAGPLLQDLNASDRVEWTDPRSRLRVFEVEGEPLLWPGLTAAVAHSVTELRAADL